MSKKSALITGVLGQDGCYLTELLLKKSYKVIGIKKRSNYFNRELIEHLYKISKKYNSELIIEDGDVTDTSNINAIINKHKPKASIEL